MSYEALGESIFNTVRRAGSTYWIELNLDERRHWEDVARAAELHIVVGHCEKCAETRWELEEAEQQIYELEEELGELEDEIKELKKS